MIKKICKIFLVVASFCFLSRFCFAQEPEIIVKFMTRNPCYTSETRKNKMQGIMIHSTASPGIMAKEWYDLWNKPVSEGGREVGVHAFVDDKFIMQYFPWYHYTWNCGRGKKGSGNGTHISIEMCEPNTIKYINSSTIDSTYYDPKSEENRKYFNSAIKNMVELCAYLCKKFDIDVANIICHQEGYLAGIASDHMDVLHWWPLHNLSMDKFRELVSKKLENKEIIYDF